MKLIPNGDGTVTMQGVQIWTSGRFRGYGSPPEGDHFKEPDLDSMVDAFHETRLKPRFYFGHPLNPWLKQRARPQGQLANMHREGDSIYADVLNVPEHVAKQAVADDVRLSPDMQKNFLDPASGKSYPWAITGLAALGAIQPGNIKMMSLGEQMLVPPAGDGPNHYAFAAHARSFYGGVDSDTRSFVIEDGRFPATSLAYVRLRERASQEQEALLRGETRSFALSGGVNFDERPARQVSGRGNALRSLIRK